MTEFSNPPLSASDLESMAYSPGYPASYISEGSRFPGITSRENEKGESQGCLASAGKV
jgi:hypothetical protein